MRIAQNNLLKQVIRELTKGGNILDLLLSSRDNLKREVHLEMVRCAWKLICFRRANYESLRQYSARFRWNQVNGRGEVESAREDRSTEAVYTNFVNKLFVNQKQRLPCRIIRLQQ